MTDEEFYIRPQDRANSYPFTNANMMEGTREFFRAYIWARKPSEKSRDRVGWCSNCGNFLSEIEMKNARQAARTGMWHNADVDCPYCGRNATIKEESRMTNYQSVYEERMIAYIYRAAWDVVYIRVWRVYANFDCSEEMPYFTPLYPTEYARYRLRPGEYVSEKFDRMADNGKWVPCFTQTAAPYEPQLGALAGLVEIEQLDHTFLKYHQLADFYSECGQEEVSKGRYYMYYQSFNAYRPLRYLCYFCLYPQMEMAAKFGLHWAVNDLVNARRKNYRDLNWSASEPHKFLRLDKATAKEYLAVSKNRDILQLLHRFKGAYGVRDCIELQSLFGTRAEESGIRIKRYGVKIGKLKKYLEKNKITVSDWMDYITGAEALDYDMTVHNVLFPRDFRAAHDGAVRGLAVAEFKKLSKAKQNALQKRAKKYEWKCGGCVFVFPVSVQEIVNEGKSLQHCVGGYAGRHIDGKTNIVFMRHADKPDESWYTIEIDGDKVRQAYGYRDRKKPQDDIEAARVFAIWQDLVAGKRHEHKMTVCGDIGTARKISRHTLAVCA